MLFSMSVEGGMSGTQRRFVCEKCGKVFFAWRPDTAPGVKVKCYYCKNEMEDEAAKRERPAAPVPAPPAAAPAAPVPAPPAAAAAAAPAAVTATAPAPAPAVPAADESPEETPANRP